MFGAAKGGEGCVVGDATCLMALLRRSLYNESLEMTTPRRHRIGPVGDVEF